MAQASTPSPDETALWQQRLAAQANNRAWRLSEIESRSPAESQEMLHAAHAAMHLWSLVGTDNHKAHAQQLLAHVHGLLGNAEAASGYLAACAPYLSTRTGSRGNRDLPCGRRERRGGEQERGRARRHYARARELIDALADPEDREILEATLAVVPSPHRSG